MIKGKNDSEMAKMLRTAKEIKWSGNKARKIDRSRQPNVQRVKGNDKRRVFA